MKAYPVLKYADNFEQDSVSLQNRLMKFGLKSLSVFLLAYSLFHNPFTFNFETDTILQYELCYCFILFPVAVFSYLKIDNIDFWVSTSLLIVIGLGCLVLWRSEKYSFSNEHFFSALIFLFFFTALRLGRLKLINFVVIIVVVSFFYELITGLVQIVAGREATGSLKNTGVFSLSMVISLPFVLYSSDNFFGSWVCGKPKAWKYGKILTRGFLKKAFIALLLSFISVILYWTKSRTGILAFIALLVILYSNYRGFLFQKKSFFKVLLPLFLFALTIGTIFFKLIVLKIGSVFGRLMLLKIAATKIDANLFFGTGLGRFSWYLPQWQSDFLKESGNIEKSIFFNASENYLLFNEYIQLFLEVGIFGSVILIVVIFLVFRAKSYRHRKLLITCKITIFLILICATSSYPFHTNYILFLLTLSLATVFKIRDRPKFNSYSFFAPNRLVVKSGVTIFYLLASLAASYTLCFQYIAINKLKSSDFGSLQVCRAIYPRLEKDGKFLYHFGTLLALNSLSSDEAIKVLEKARKEFQTAQVVETLANVYLDNGQYTKASENFIWLNNFVPSKFRYKFELLKVYEKLNERKKMMTMAEKILSMPIKVNSVEVEKIRMMAQEILVKEKRGSHDRTE